MRRSSTPASVSALVIGALDAPPGTPNARRVSCGVAECTREGDGRGREICCVTPGIPPQSKCTRELDTAACDQGRRECDDTADCSDGQVCCAETSNNDTMSTRCMPTCITGVERWQVCKTTAECDPRDQPRREPVRVLLQARRERFAGDVQRLGDAQHHELWLRVRPRARAPGGSRDPVVLAKLIVGAEAGHEARFGHLVPRKERWQASFGACPAR